MNLCPIHEVATNYREDRCWLCGGETVDYHRGLSDQFWENVESINEVIEEALA